MPVQLLCIADVAVLLKIKPRTAVEWVRAGIIPSFKIGSKVRIHPEALTRWLAQQAGLPVEERRRPGRPLKDFTDVLEKAHSEAFKNSVH